MGFNESRIKQGTKLISINSVDLLGKANYQDFQRFQVVDVQMAADAQATLPALIEAVRAAIPASRKTRSRSAAKPRARPRPKRGSAISRPWRSAGTRARSRPRG